MERYCGVTPTRADRALWIVIGVGLAFAVSEVVRAEWLKVSLTFGVLVAILVTRQLRGPFLGKPLLELTDSELIIRQPFYVPTKVQKLTVGRLRRLEIVGPSGDRRFRFSLSDGTITEIRPYFREAEEGAVKFIKANLVGIQIVEKEPPGILEEIRGDY